MPKTLEEKKEVAEELSRLLEEAETVYLTDFSGLDVGSMTELRARLREEGVGYRVAKNTLMARALDRVEELPDLEEHLRGPTGLVLGGEDPVTPAKIVRDFAREHEDRPTVKVGVVDRRTLSPEEVDELADLPTREEMLASIVGSVTAPVSGIVGALDALLRDIGHMAHEAAKKREAEEA
jgi:large subunit ribosomal protein L10